MSTSDDFLAAQKVIHRFFKGLDFRDYADLASLIAPGGHWVRQGKTLNGPQGVIEALNQRPADFTTIHAVTNLLLDGAGDRLTGSFYSIAFAHTGEVPDGPIKMELPNVVAVYTVELVRSGSGWLIEKLASKRHFQRAA